MMYYEVRPMKITQKKKKTHQNDLTDLRIEITKIGLQISNDEILKKKTN